MVHQRLTPTLGCGASQGFFQRCRELRHFQTQQVYELLSCCVQLLDLHGLRLFGEHRL